MQIGQQFINLLIRKHISKAVHLISAHSNDVLDAIIVCRHAADGKLFALKQAFQARTLPFLRRIRQMATVAILIVDVTAGRLARGQSELGIALAPLNLACGTESDQKDRHARQRSDIRAPDIKQLAGKKNSSHAKIVGRSIHLYRIANVLRPFGNTSKDSARFSHRKIQLTSERPKPNPAKMLENRGWIGYVANCNVSSCTNSATYACEPAALD
jgi:hypothetical protein